ncbi:segregation and condensation protein A [Arthrobacter mobilis]|uniref:Segregation and condensation protein A n=1 Tax=Arthrobacter mobilis TaxID=2724944 RepID=A0A7X6HF21_9MICC|nr:segregation/condensation protein A [Arthrobacter mobilis]NKX54978.1 segregation/condensation protein A [Arthrobacter mobilis]
MNGPGPVADQPLEPAAQAPQALPRGKQRSFEVTLDNFSGPFDLLLGLIAKHEMDITEIALAKVTDEFISYIRRLRRDGEWALDEASEFLVMAATLLDLKAAKLLPSGEVESEEDIALLEARDLLFARLLQYKAFKGIAGLLSRQLAEEGQRYPRQVPLEPQFAALLPELVWRTSPQDFAALAAKALQPKPPAPTEVGLSHLHAPKVSVREQAGIIASRLRAAGPQTFGVLTADAEGTLVVVARFLALLELFRAAVVAFDQQSPLAELTVRWTGPESAWSAERLGEEYDNAEYDDAEYDDAEYDEVPEGH